MFNASGTGRVDPRRLNVGSSSTYLDSQKGRIACKKSKINGRVVAIWKPHRSFPAGDEQPALVCLVLFQTWGMCCPVYCSIPLYELVMNLCKFMDRCPSVCPTWRNFNVRKTFQPNSLIPPMLNGTNDFCLFIPLSVTLRSAGCQEVSWKLYMLDSFSRALHNWWDEIWCGDETIQADHLDTTLEWELTDVLRSAS